MSRWLPGRQGTGYQKLPLLRLPAVDAYLLRFPEGSHVPRHVDPVPGRRHWRLNVTLVAPGDGGEFVCGRAWRLGRRVTLFRPDRDVHSVTRVTRGTRVVLSVGWTIRERGRV